jgi:two-component SAPR family response regulator
VPLIDSSITSSFTISKEILGVNPHQRIIFASAYVKDTVTDSIMNLKQLKEYIQKPFGMQKLVDLIEDKRIHEELQKLNVTTSSKNLICSFLFIIKPSCFLFLLFF